MKKLIVAMMTAVMLTACTAQVDSVPSDSRATTADSFPRTVDFAGTEVEVPAKPERIAVVSPDLTSLVLPIVGKERVVMASEMNPALGKVAEEANAVEHLAKVGVPLDPEQILSIEPDLVMVSAHHDEEKDVARVLAKSGVPTAILDSDSWTGIDDMLTHIDEVAALVGEEAAGAELRKSIEAQRAEAAVKVTDEPAVLTLMHLGGKSWIMPKTTMLNGLVREVGGKPVVDGMDADGSLPADPELIIDSEPDIVIVQSYRGKGTEPLTQLLADPALAEVPAVANNRIYYVDSASTGVTSGPQIIDGLQQVSYFLNQA